MTTEKPVIVLGNDGSKASEPALRWALQQARATGGQVQVVRGWTMATAPRPESQTIGYVPPLADFEAAVVKAIEANCAAIVAEFPEVEVAYVAKRGPAANALLDCAEVADLVVVGARGLGGFRGLALGSTSDQVTRHAACPVVVVRYDKDAQTERSLPRE